MCYPDLSSHWVMLVRVIPLALFWTAGGAVAGVGETWTWRNPLPQGSGLKTLVESGGRLIATGRAGTVLTTPDGMTWTLRTTGSRDFLQAAAASGSVVVAAGRDGDVVTSTDAGLTWNRTYRFPNAGTERREWKTVVRGGSLWVVAGARSGVSSTLPAKILTSPDGITWTEVDLPVPLTNFFNASVWTGTRFILSGQTFNLASPSLAVTSENGVTWTARDVAHGVTGTAWSGARVVAAGGAASPAASSSPDGITWTEHAGVLASGVIWSGTAFLSWSPGRLSTSSDGVAWTVRTFPALLSRPEAAAANGSTFLVVGDNGSIARSMDNGATWNTVASGVVKNLKSVIRFAGRWVAVGGDGALTSSADGVTWTRGSSGNDSHLRAVAWHHGLWVACGNDSRADIRMNAPSQYEIFTSPDGVTWTDRSFQSSSFNPNQQIYSVAYISSQWVACAKFFMLTSPDGIVWTEHRAVADGFDDENRAIAGVGSRLVIAGGLEDEEDGGSDQIHLSTDAGVSWTSQRLGADFLRGVTWTGSQFVAVGDQGGIFTSPLGTAGTWTARTSGTFRDLRGITATSGLLVAVGGNFSAPSVILTSPDGITWTSRSLPALPATQVLYSVLKAGAEWVAVGYDGIVLTSPDATTWTLRTAPTTHELLACGWDGTQLLVCGENGAILSSSTSAYSAGYAAWQAANFTLPAEAGIAAAGEDPDKDGVVNLIEYAGKTAPKIPNQSPGTLTRTAGGDLQLVMEVRDDDPALSAIGQSGSDLSTLAGSLLPIITDPVPSDGLRRWTFTDVPPGGANPKRFLRAKFSLTP